MRLIEVANADIGRTDADTFRAGGPGRDWCAYWVSSVLERAELPAPAPGTRARRGAQALVRWLGDGGEWVVRPGGAVRAADLQPGDVIAWRASRIPGDWRGHIAIVTGVLLGGALEIVHGNARGAVRREVLGRDRWPRLRAGGVYGVARVTMHGMHGP